jgi:predicted MFS family arabinose efflux permease
LYTFRFGQLFLTAVCFMTGVGLQFHFGQYIGFLGRSERDLGLVLGLGMIGSLCARPFVGSLVDRFGAKPGLVAAGLLSASTAVCFPFTSDLPVVCVIRVLATTSVATFFTALAVIVSRMAPPRRSAEALGMVGVGGFVGMMIGPTLGDAIFARGTDEIRFYYIFFFTTAAASALATGLATTLRVSDLSVEHRSTWGASARVVFRHWPGLVLLIGIVFSMAQTVPSSFLERMAEERGFKDIKLFFLAYAPTAIVLRFVFRRLPERFGRRRTCILGLLLYGAGMFWLRKADSQGGLVLPAMLLGAGHCFVFPSMVDLAADRLPPEHRGLGTSLILGAGDVGFLVGAITWGQVITARGYEATLVAVALACLATAVLFAWSQRAVVFRRSA